MKKILIYFLVILGVSAQEVLIREARNVGSTKQHTGSFKTLKTTADTLQLPFTEHFKQSSYEVNPFKWISAGVKVHFKGACVPDYGFAILDGSDSLNLPYTPLQQDYGRSDSLTSACIDLSAYSPADSLYLSFFVQNGGSYEPAEAQDSLILEFKTSDSSFAEVWNAVGTDLPQNQAREIMIPLLDSAYFLPCFQFQFLRAGSRNGRYDNFILDAIRLDKNRTFDDTLKIASLQAVLSSPFSNGYNLPLKHHNVDTLLPLQITFFNNRGNPVNLNLQENVSEIQNNQFNSNNSLNISISTTCADTQNVGNKTAVSLTQNAKFSYDFIQGNDTINVTFGIDSVWAYDDGSAESAYGITEAASFGQTYTLLQPDTLKAVGISFAPSQYKFNQKAFVLEIRARDANGNIDTVLHSQNVRLGTGKAPDEFVRYPLDSLLPLPEKFFIAVRQYDANPLGIGFDLDTDNSDKIFYQKNGIWRQTSYKGTLMIRPEFLGGASSKLPAKLLSQQSHRIIKIFPNPSEDVLRIAIPDKKPAETVHFSLFSPTGRLILTGTGEELNLSALPKGTYILRIELSERRYFHKVVKL